jgi:hypothetical protein
LTIDYPSKLKAGEKGELTLVYSVAANIYGTLADKLEISVQGVTQTQVIETSGTAIEKTDKNSKKKPQLRYQPSFVNFGKKKASGKFTAQIELYNDGNAPLVIRHIENEEGTSIGLSPGTTIEPGKKKSVTLTFTPPANRKGVHNGGVTLITNEPGRPLREIKCKVIIN